MSDFDSLCDDIGAIEDALGSYTRAVARATEIRDAEIAKIWKAIEGMGDEQHALANRIENLTRALFIEPAEVAQKIVNDANRATLHEVRKPYDQEDAS